MNVKIIIQNKCDVRNSYIFNFQCKCGGLYFKCIVLINTSTNIHQVNDWDKVHFLYNGQNENIL